MNDKDKIEQMKPLLQKIKDICVEAASDENAVLDLGMIERWTDDALRIAGK